MISIIMAVWNGTRFMDKAIASVVCQTSPDWELLIVDDGSTDDSAAKAASWRDLVNNHLGEEKVRLFFTGMANSGPQVGRNLAAEHARYDIFAYLDQDDIFFPHRIQTLAPMFDRYDLVFAPYEVHEPNHSYVWDLRSLWHRDSFVTSSEGERDPPFELWIRKVMTRQEACVPLGVSHRRDVFEQVGGFQPGIVSGASGILWRRMSEKGARAGFCPVLAGRYNVRPDSQARTRKPFSIGGIELQKDHPLGANGQYLDAEWFASVQRHKGKEALSP
jgi:glycosyltransferase involved in cell wall biosynthesis